VSGIGTMHHQDHPGTRLACTYTRTLRSGPDAGSGLTKPERSALSGLAPPASTVLRIPLREARLRHAVDPGDFCQAQRA
jgi:hypothetical protein